MKINKNNSIDRKLIEAEEINEKLNAIDKLNGLLNDNKFLIEEFDLIISKRLSFKKGDL
jgi:hypothetical protein